MLKITIMFDQRSLEGDQKRREREAPNPNGSLTSDHGLKANMIRFRCLIIFIDQSLSRFTVAARKKVNLHF